MQEDSLLNVTDVALQLRVTEETVRDWLRRNEIHGYNLGGRAGWRVPSSEIARFLATKAGTHPIEPAGTGEER